MEEVEDDLAEELKSKCPVDVFDIEDRSKLLNLNVNAGIGKALWYMNTYTTESLL